MWHKVTTLRKHAPVACQKAPSGHSGGYRIAWLWVWGFVRLLGTAPLLAPALHTRSSCFTINQRKFKGAACEAHLRQATCTARHQGAVVVRMLRNKACCAAGFTVRPRKQSTRLHNAHACSCKHLGDPEATAVTAAVAAFASAALPSGAPVTVPVYSARALPASAISAWVEAKSIATVVITYKYVTQKNSCYVPVGLRWCWLQEVKT